MQWLCGEGIPKEENGQSRDAVDSDEKLALLKVVRHIETWKALHHGR
jgi:hypothetical protein